MRKKDDLTDVPQRDPQILWEELALSQNWNWEKSSPFEICIEVEEIPLSFFNRWHASSGYLEIIGVLDIALVEDKKLEVFQVLSALSSDTYLGSYILCPHYEKPTFKYGLLSYPHSPITLEHLLEVTEEAVSVGGKICQALGCLFLEGKTLEEALFDTCLDVMGEA